MSAPSERKRGKEYDASVFQYLGELADLIYYDQVRESPVEYIAEFFRLYSSVESPIEARMALALASFRRVTFIRIEPQQQIASYRVDFLVSFDGEMGKGLVIECDGHNFHERTKEQAAADRQRDRELQRLGYRVLRFTGSEIHTSLPKVQDEIRIAILSMLDDSSPKRRELEL